MRLSRQREEQQVLHCLFFPSLRIEEEELDKYSIPAKTESDKYKVIRTFSFLKSRMSSTRNKTKVEGKKKTKNKKTSHKGCVVSPSLGQGFGLFRPGPMGGAGTEEMFFESVKARVTEQMRCPASFLSMINPLF